MINFLKLFYHVLLVGLPSTVYNPINKNILHAPFIIKEESTYINYKLNNLQVKHLTQFLNNNFELIPVKLLNEDLTEDFFISINIYNCTSPLFDFMTDKPATRCEINTYVVDKYSNKGTIIIDYVSNLMSLDPDNIFKHSGNTGLSDDKYTKSGYSYSDNIKLDFKFDKNKVDKTALNVELIKLTDKIFYKNGLYDKLYYDSSLLHNKIIKCNDYDVNFNFLNIDFTDIHSVFYFQEEISFVSGLWHNIFN